jgi:hypothetical protein
MEDLIRFQKQQIEALQKELAEAKKLLRELLTEIEA